MLGWVINLGGGRDAGRAFTSHTIWYVFVRIYSTPYDLISLPPSLLLSLQPIPGSANPPPLHSGGSLARADRFRSACHHH